MNDIIVQPPQQGTQQASFSQFHGPVCEWLFGMLQQSLFIVLIVTQRLLVDTFSSRIIQQRHCWAM